MLMASALARSVRAWLGSWATRSAAAASILAVVVASDFILVGQLGLASASNIDTCRSDRYCCLLGTRALVAQIDR
jgi:hypothetical protein